MNFANITALKDYIRRYNSHSILQMGANICWSEWKSLNGKTFNEWTLTNTRKNITIRLILLASAGTPDRHQNINQQEFYNLANDYYNLQYRFISNIDSLNNEAIIIAKNIKDYEKNKEKDVKNWEVKLSDCLTKEKICSHISELFCQRLAAFQNRGFGSPTARINRILKFINIINHSHPDILKKFMQLTGLSTEIYFNQFISVIGWGLQKEDQGLINFAKPINLEKGLDRSGITLENLEKFVSLNSLPFNLSTVRGAECFWTKVEASINKVDEPYQSFFYNALLNTPFIYLGQQKYCLPDPLSLTESCWNQLHSHVLSSYEPSRKKRDEILSKAFETYLETVFLPQTVPNSFEKIPEDETNAQNKAGKRADFLIRLPNVYILIECKNSLMSADDSAYFDPKGLANLYGRLHGATEQIAETIKAYNLKDKPVIPLILSFYDAITASQIFEFMVRETDYCSVLGLTIPPIVRSLHEFEHWTKNRSLENWAELQLEKAKEPRYMPPDAQGQPQPPIVSPDNKGHNYRHLADCEFFKLYP